MKRRQFLLTISGASATLLAPPALGQTLQILENARLRISQAYTRAHLTTKIDPDDFEWINTISHNGCIIFDESSDFTYPI